MSVKNVSFLAGKGLINAPGYVKSPEYEVIMGSFAYGVSSDTSDIDIYGWTIPDKETVFPHLGGHIHGFGKPPSTFEQFQEHHIKWGEKEYDICIYNIVKYFSLCIQNNPNMIDSMFVPPNCIITSSKIADIVRDRRSEFLHKGCYHKFKGYAYSQLHKCRNKTHEHLEDIDLFENKHQIIHTTSLQDITIELRRRENDHPIVSLSQDLKRLTYAELRNYHTLFIKGIEKSRRFESTKVAGLDRKFLYHVVRLADECEQILETGTLDLHHAREHLKAIRRGEVTLDEVEKWFHEKERHLEKLYSESTAIPHSPDENAIKQLLIDCLEMKYGTLEKAAINVNKAEDLLRQIKSITDQWG